jgi:hypothetical protein
VLAEEEEEALPVLAEEEAAGRGLAARGGCGRRREVAAVLGSERYG